MRVIVCGGRDYGLTDDERGYILDELLDFHERKGEITHLLASDAYGVASVAADWAMANGIEATCVCPNFEEFGRAAVAVCHAGMLKDFDVDFVIAFHGGVDTEDLVHKAAVAGVPVHIILKEAG